MSIFTWRGWFPPNNFPMVDGIAFNPVAGTPAYAEGVIFWNGQDKTLNVDTGLDAVTGQVNQEGLLMVRNNSGATIPNGSVVKLTGALGIRPTASLGLESDVIIGLSTQDIANNEFGFVSSYGLVHDINTTAFTAGDTVYASSVTPGALATTGTKRVGTVIVSHITQGVILLVAPVN